MERKKEGDPLTPAGDATELGLNYFFENVIKTRSGMDIDTYRNMNFKVHEIPFSSTSKWQMSIHALTHQMGKEFIFLKGAPDVLIDKCSQFVGIGGDFVDIDLSFMSAYREACDSFAGSGERVLAFAMKALPKSVVEIEEENKNFREELKAQLIEEPGKSFWENGPEYTNPHAKHDFIFIGLISLMDPPRPEVPKAIEDCHSAGIQVVMITGDHPITAAAIARKVGLLTLPTRVDIAKHRGIHPDIVNEDDVLAVVVHGTDIELMGDDDWANLLEKQQIVFARTSPEQKLVIVSKFTESGHLVAMTGDGVNDAPALKKAAIGVAIGKDGSDVAREAADIILLDDNFASIVIGIKEGRLLFANLKKSIAYTLAHSLPEVASALAYAVLSLPLPVTAVLLLCIDLITELVPSVSLAYETAESNIMIMPPRRSGEDRLVSMSLLCYSYFQIGLILTVACFYVYFLTFMQYGITPQEVLDLRGHFFNDHPAGDYHAWSGQIWTVEQQQHLMAIIHGSYFLMLVFGQACHIWVCRTMEVSIFEHGIFTNMTTNIGVLIALALGLALVYAPFLQYVDGAADPSIVLILIVTAYTFFAIWGFAEGRKWYIRSYPDSFVTRCLRW